MTPEAFAARLEECTSALWTVAAGILGDRSGAEDVVQEAALIAWQKRDEFERGTSFRAWLGRIVRNVALNHARLVQRRRTHPTDGALLDEHPSRGATTMTEDERRVERLADDPAAVAADAPLFDGELADALAQLTPVARACLLLKTVLELEYREIAELLDVPEGTAMSHVHRARRRLRAHLSETAEDTRSRVEPRS